MPPYDCYGDLKMTNQELMSMYENVANITDEMVAAAEVNNWELLASLEQKCSSLVKIIENNEAPVVLAVEERARKVCVIKKILDDDRKIRDITQPRMAHLSDLIHKSSTQLKLARAYQLDHRQK